MISIQHSVVDRGLVLGGTAVRVDAALKADSEGLQEALPVAPDNDLKPASAAAYFAPVANGAPRILSVSEITEHPSSPTVVSFDTGESSVHEDSELQIFRPVLAHMMGRAGEIPEDGIRFAVLAALQTKNEAELPFWFGQSFDLVLRELLVNAIRSIRQAQKAEGRIVISASWSKDKFEISITDNGMGLPVTGRKRLFKKNFTTKTVSRFEAQNVGLGLYYSREFVRTLLRGDITAYDNAERDPQQSGATFTISLPL